MKSLTPFAVYRNGEPIQLLRLKQGVRTGIEITGLLVGLVPELEEREASLFCGYTWKEWNEFSLTDPVGRWERASGIAHYRVHNLIKQHSEDAVSEEIDRRSKAHR